MKKEEQAGTFRRIINWFHKDYKKEEEIRSFGRYREGPSFKRKLPFREVEFSRLRILLAEDSAVALTMGCDLLEQAGASVNVADHGKEALRLFEESEVGYYHVIITDISMRAMNGDDMAVKIRKLRRSDGDQVLIIALTGAYDQERINYLYHCGIDYHMEKPLEITALTAVLNKFLMAEE